MLGGWSITGSTLRQWSGPVRRGNSLWAMHDRNRTGVLLVTLAEWRTHRRASRVWRADFPDSVEVVRIPADGRRSVARAGDARPAPGRARTERNKRAMASPREVVILGSTGSIGVQAIDVAKRNPDRLRVVGLAAGGSDPETLAAQALDLGVSAVAVARASASSDLQLAFYAEAQRRDYPSGGFRVPKILAGPDAAAELAASECDVVLNGITGSIGLGPTLAALGAGRQLALANKESLIAGGQLVKAAAQPGQIVPVDSEHS